MGLLLKLKDGDTNLKSLRYGNDRPNGGNSGQPYITTPLPGSPKPPIEEAETYMEIMSSEASIIKSQYSTFSKKLPANTSIDGIIRGGVNAPLHAIDDVMRLSKLLINTNNPTGLLFTLKQNLLSRIAPETEATKGPAYGMGTINDGIYTPLSTIAQAGVGFLGTHLNKQGLDPTGIFPFADINKYEDVAFNNNKERKNKQGEAKTKLFGKNKGEARIKKIGRNKGDVKFKRSRFSNRLLEIWDDTGMNPSQKREKARDYKGSTIRKYGGGPGSLLGVGNTRIKFATKNDGKTPLRTVSLLSKKDLKKEKENISQKKIDERYQQSRIERQGYETRVVLNNKTTFNGVDLRGRGNIRTIGDAGTNRARNTVINPITANPIFVGANDYERNNQYDVNRQQNRKEIGDLIELTIATSPGYNPTEKSYLTFPAYLDGYSDNFSSDYKKIRYMGRSEDFYRYQGFSRNIGLSFTVVAQSKKEIGNMYKKLNHLASSIGGSYTQAGYLSGVVTYLTVGNLLRKQPGILTAFSYEVPQECTWDIGTDLREIERKDYKRKLLIQKIRSQIDQGTYTTGAKGKSKSTIQDLDFNISGTSDRITGPDGQVPMMIKVTGFSFTPIYEFLPQINNGDWFSNTNVTTSDYNFPDDDFGKRYGTLNNKGNKFKANPGVISVDVNL